MDSRFKQILERLLNKDHADACSLGKLTFVFRNCHESFDGYYIISIDQVKEKNTFHVVLRNCYEDMVDEFITYEGVEAAEMNFKFEKLKAAFKERVINYALEVTSDEKRSQTFEDVRESLVSDENEQS